MSAFIFININRRNVSSKWSFADLGQDFKQPKLGMIFKFAKIFLNVCKCDFIKWLTLNIFTK